MWENGPGGCSPILPLSFRDVSVNYADLPIQEPLELLLDLPLQSQILHVCVPPLEAPCFLPWHGCQSPLSPRHPPPQRLSEAAPCVIGISLMKKGCVSLITVTVSESTSELIYSLSLGKTRSSIKKFTLLLPVAIKEPVLF